MWVTGTGWRLAEINICQWSILTWTSLRIVVMYYWKMTTMTNGFPRFDCTSLFEDVSEAAKCMLRFIAIIRFLLRFPLAFSPQDIYYSDKDYVLSFILDQVVAQGPLVDLCLFRHSFQSLVFLSSTDYVLTEI